MAQFSVRDGIRFSFSTYGKHCVLLLSAAALVAGSYWFSTVAPRFVAEKLGVHQVLDIDMVSVMQQPQDQATDQSTMVLRKVQEVTSKVSMHLQAAPKHLLALVLLVFLLSWGLYLMMVLGFIKLVLTLKDKNSGSLELLFSVSARQVMRFIGGSILFMLYVICVLIGMSVLTIPFAMLCKGILGDGIALLLTLLLWLVLVVAMLFWAVGYMFYGFCIIDKPTIGAREALRMSRDISSGSRRHIVTAVIVAMLFASILMFVINKLVMMSCACSLEQQKLVVMLAVMVVGYPFSMPFFSYIYRSLTTAGR